MLPHLTPLDPFHLPDLLEYLGSDPVPSVFLIYLARRTRLEASPRGIEFFGHFDANGRLVGAGVVGPTLLLHAPRDLTVELFARKAIGESGRWRSLLGDRRSMDPLWTHMSPHVGAPDEDRYEEWLSLDRETARLDGWPLPSGLRRAAEADLPALMPLRSALYDEPGRKPVTPAEHLRVQRRCRDACRDGALFLVERDGRPVFTAAFTAMTPEAIQISSVLTDVEYRNQGIATAALAQICRWALAESQRVSLFVARENVAARRVYGKLGFSRVAEARSMRFHSDD